ncbi:MAG: phosphotransferase family protein [Aeromicrobium sp.]|nr:phosphotransferase family protein [Aeromicrobium sp.]
MTETWGPALQEWLGQQLGSTRGTVTNVTVEGMTRPSVGQSSDTILFTLTWSSNGAEHESDLVLRVQPTADGIFDQPDAIREARVIAGVPPTVPVPRLRWVEETGDVLGRPFFVMEQVFGTVPGAKPSIHAAGWLPTLTPEVRRRLWDNALDALVAIHATPWQTQHTFLRRAGDSSLRAHLDRLGEWYAWATKGREYPVTDAALERLRDGLADVTPVPDSLVWGDARIGNMMFADDGTLSAVLDWELATVGPPQIDVAHWLVFDDFATKGAGVERLEGFPGRDETIAEYERRSGRVLTDLPYFETLQLFMLATTLIRQADMRVARGELQPDTRMGHANAVSVLLAERLGLPVPEISADYLAHRTAR